MAKYNASDDNVSPDASIASAFNDIEPSGTMFGIWCVLKRRVTISLVRLSAIRNRRAIRPFVQLFEKKAAGLDVYLFEHTINRQRCRPLSQHRSYRNTRSLSPRQVVQSSSADRRIQDF